MPPPTPRFSLNPVDFPSPPAAMARIVRLASDPDVTSASLGAAISTDPAFTAELLRTVNSPFYGLKSSITAASRAATVLGIRALRNLAICFSVREALRTSSFRAHDLDAFWQDCLRRGVAARTLARVSRCIAPDEAFTLGLLQDFGMLALLRDNRKEAAQWHKWQALLPDERKVEEQARFGMTHDSLCRVLGQHWGLPQQLTESLAWHHTPTDPAVPSEARDLAKIAFVADLICCLMNARSAEALGATRAAMWTHFGIAEPAADKLLAGIAPEVEAAAAALGMDVAQQPSFASVLAEASRTLVEMNTSYEELTQRLEATLAQKDSLVVQLAEANAALALLAFYDPLTGLYSRRHYDTLLPELLTRAALESKPIALVMLDLDRFKLVNDTHGHTTGDKVLRMVAQALAAAGVDTDIKARIGGEEFAIVLPGMTVQAAMAVAERLREAVAAGSVATPTGTLHVTASFGVVAFVGTGTPVDAERLAVLLAEVADKALYESKNAGRNRVTVGGVIR